MRQLSSMGAFSCALLLTSSALANVPDDDPDRTLSPYFLVNSADPGVDQLPLKATKADVDIAGVIAHVRVTQVYQNEGGSPLEAVYVFPGSTRAAVFAMKMTIGERTIQAKIEEKNKARQIYEEAKNQGKSASLLEQKRPNVFQMNVANIMPGDRIEVQLDYVEALVPTDGVYEFVYPTVVGPRYADAKTASQPSESWIQNPHTAAGVAPTYRWDLSAKINAGMGLKSVTSPSHQISPQFLDTSRARVELDDETGGNRDFVLRYKLRGDRVETGVLLFPGKKESFFLAMMQPPKRTNPYAVPPREYIFIVDVSGSMGGFPLDTAKSLMRELGKDLRPIDRINLMMFSGGNTVLSPTSLEATPENVQLAIDTLDRQRGGGGTQLLPAMKQALSMPRSSEMSTSFVVITDGYVAIEKEAFELTRQRLGEANMFAFGIGSSVNRHLIEGLARAGMGEPFVVLNPTEAESKAKKFRKYIDSPVLTRIKVDFDGFKAYDVVPQTIPDLFAERPVLIFGKYKGPAEGHIRIEGRNGLGRYSQALNVGDHMRGAEDNQALRYLWARHRVAVLMDDRAVRSSGEIDKEITNLGLTYNLMTEMTSFVAVDNVVRNTEGKSTTVRQPLPMPKGVPNSAVGTNGVLSFRSSAKSKTYAPVMSAPASGEVTGMGGLGVSGIGSGGGGVAYGAGMGTGRVGTRGHGKAGPAEPAPPPRVTGSLDKSQIEKVIKKSKIQIAKVFEEQLKSNPKLSGRIVVELVIAPNGTVEKVKIVSSTLGDKVLEQKIRNILIRLRFPAPKGGGRVVIKYPFVLKSS